MSRYEKFSPEAYATWLRELNSLNRDAGGLAESEFDASEVRHLGDALFGAMKLDPVGYVPIEAWGDVSEEATDRLQGLGLKVEAVRLAAQDNFDLEALYADYFVYEDLSSKLRVHRSCRRPFEPRAELMKELEHSERAFQVSAAMRGVIFSPCPMSGRVLQSRYSFLIPCAAAKQTFIAYYFLGEVPFFIITGGFAGTKIIMYLPHCEALIRLECQHHQWGDPSISVNCLKSLIHRHEAEVRRYLENKTTPTLAAGLLDSFGHWLWNDLSGIVEFSNCFLLENVSDVIAGVFDYFDTVSLCSNSGISQKTVVSDLEDLFEQGLRMRAFVFRPTSAIVTKEAADRLKARAESKASSRQMKLANEAYKAGLVLWVNVRAHNKVWENQVAEISDISKTLVEKYGALSLYLDGTSDCRDIVANIKEAADPNVTIYDGTDVTPYDSIYWAGRVTTYVATIGTGLIVVSWIGNKRGVAHAEHAHLNQMEWWGEVRNDIAVPLCPEHADVMQSEPNKSYINYTTKKGSIGNLLFQVTSEMAMPLHRALEG